MEIVLSDESGYDQYDNFRFKDKGGKDYKVGAKNRKQDELAKVVVDNPNRAVKLIFDTVKGKDGKDHDYISGIELLEIQVDGAKITEQQAPQPKTVAPQELGMWWKELGNRIGDGSIDKDFPKSAVKIKGQYYKQMETITGITFKED